MSISIIILILNLYPSHFFWFIHIMKNKHVKWEKSVDLG
jgi:hypothetical protein